MVKQVQTVLLSLGLLSGLCLAYIDSLPKWDDTGILVGSLLLVSALLTFLGYRRPWLLALAVGLWIPLHSLYLSHDPRIMVVFVFPLVGAYTGWAARAGLRRTLGAG
jgi:hypothetical protein